MGLPSYLQSLFTGSSVESCNIRNDIHNFLAGMELRANGPSDYSTICVSLDPNSHTMSSSSPCGNYNRILDWYKRAIQELLLNQEPFTVDLNHPKSLFNQRNIEKIRALLDTSPDFDDKADLERFYARILEMREDLLPYEAPTRSISSVISAIKSYFS